jgi:signal transduction histidine kinase
MLVGIGFLILTVAVALLIAVDVTRTPIKARAEQPDGHGHDAAIAAARGGTGVRAFSREPAVRQKTAPPAAPPAAAGVRLGAGPVAADSFNRPGETARAFDQMRRETSQSAASEAALRSKFNARYVNLSRRNQALVERQLRLIESLQHGEHDQRRLASLTKLDRIAMRMHRNSQNLLVLAGQEPTTAWTQPVTLAYLVEAALTEVEEYERVSFEVQPDIALRGPAVHDAVHLLVELIENATAFSAAEMPVNITGRILTSGGALVDITDQGIGMPAKDMAYANQQLDNPPPPDTDFPKWMGLLVVARLAARHGIRVRLNQAESGGLTALVWFPDEILTHYSAAVDPGRAAAEQRGATISPVAFASAQMNTQDATATRPHPAWSARSAQATVPAEPAAAVRLPASARSDVPGGDVGVVVPQADSPARMHGPPIYDEVESRWSRGGREAFSSVGFATASGPAAASGPSGFATASGPVAASGPSGFAPAPGSAGRATAAGPAAPSSASSGPAASGPAASGLPRRPPAAPAGSRGVPGTPPDAPNRSGLPSRQSWAAPAEEANPAGQDES